MTISNNVIIIVNCHYKIKCIVHTYQLVIVVNYVYDCKGVSLIAHLKITNCVCFQFNVFFFAPVETPTTHSLKKATHELAFIARASSDVVMW